MNYRQYNKELVETQENLRIELLISFYAFNITKINSILSIEDSINARINKLIDATKGSSEEHFFDNYKFLLSSLFHLLKWGQNEMNAHNGSFFLNASKTNIEQIDLVFFDYIYDFKTDIFELQQLILNINKVNEIKSVLDRFLKIPFPTIYTFEVDQFLKFKRSGINEINEEEDQEIIIVSIQFEIDGEPWANPQILKPEELYIIKGKLSFNKWPNGFDTLILKPVSTSSNDWFDLSLPEVKKSSKNENEITGHVIFKYPQNSFDESISIRLFGYFINRDGLIQYPTIIGYDQLIVKVLDANSNRFLTGFNKMNKVIFDIANTIQKELSGLDKKEFEDFINLLSGILNYQGFCLQQGLYKNQSKVLEDTFRDNLIQHLIGLPYLGEDICKEAHLAGGRIEIGYKGIIAELKVENNISDRNVLFRKYGKQPVAYASGNMKQLSILCILDLTEKMLPPASPQNNVQLLTPKLHGFDDNEPENPSKLVMIIIDGNTKKPSDYSK